MADRFEKFKQLNIQQLEVLKGFSPEQLLAIFGENAATKEEKAMARVSLLNTGHAKIIEMSVDNNIIYMNKGENIVINQVGGITSYVLISGWEPMSNLLAEYPDINFVVYPEKGKEYINFKNGIVPGNWSAGYEIEAMSSFRKTKYWAFFEGVNENLPKSGAFVQDPVLDNVYYPRYWEIFHSIKDFEDLAVILGYNDDTDEEENNDQNVVVENVANNNQIVAVNNQVIANNNQNIVNDNIGNRVRNWIENNLPLANESCKSYYERFKINNNNQKISKKDFKDAAIAAGLKKYRKFGNSFNGWVVPEKVDK